MIHLPPPDSHHLAAAKGWLELLALEDAARELKAIRPEHSDHFEVFEVRGAIAATTSNWQEARAVSLSLSERLPEDPKGWIYQGSSRVELNRPQDAFAALHQGHQRFPQDEIITYDLACVRCGLGREDAAVEWIRKATEIAGEEIVRLALNDPDLEGIHARLQKQDD